MPARIQTGPVIGSTLALPAPSCRPGNPAGTGLYGQRGREADRGRICRSAPGPGSATRHSRTAPALAEGRRQGVRAGTGSSGRRARPVSIGVVTAAICAPRPPWSVQHEAREHLQPVSHRGSSDDQADREDPAGLQDPRLAHHRFALLADFGGNPEWISLHQFRPEQLDRKRPNVLFLGQLPDDADHRCDAVAGNQS